MALLFPRLSFLPWLATREPETLDRFLRADRVPRTPAMFIDPDDCELGRRLEADRARGVVRDRRSNSAAEKARNGREARRGPRPARARYSD